MADGLGWALDNANVSVKVKPRRPYTPYNIFYLLERERLVQEPNVSSNAASTNRERVYPEDDVELPARYKGIVMNPQWYDPNRKEKRKHRKTHGKISFQELTEQISKNWATIDEESKRFCTLLSEIGRKRYKHNMNRFAASKKILELKHEKSMVLASASSSPARTVPQRPPPPTIHAVTPDRSHVKPRPDPKHQPPVITPPYNPYANRRPMYYPPSPYYGHASDPPPMPSPPPPMPGHVSHQYRPYAGMPHRPPPPMPPPMPSSSSHHHVGYHHPYAYYNSHGNAYHNGYVQDPHGHRASQNEHEYYSHHHSQIASYGAAPDRYPNNHVPETRVGGYKSDEKQIKEEYYSDSITSESKVLSSVPSPNTLAEESFINHDIDPKINSTMSFDFIKTNQMHFNLSLDNLNRYGDSSGNEDRFETVTEEYLLQEDEESILGLLREDLAPFDTNNPIPFQLSWDNELRL